MSVEPANTVAAYDAVADEWDRGLGYRSPRFAARMRDRVVRLLQPAAGAGLALELGAGTGWLLDATAPLFRELHAIEPSAGMLKACNDRVTRIGLNTVRAYAEDATSLGGIADGSVDAIYAVGLLDAVPDPGQVLAASYRVLKPGGLLVISTANGSCPWYSLRDRLLGVRDVRTGRYFTADDLAGAARLAGFAQVDLETWGAAPQRMTFAPAVAAFGMLERLVTAVGLSGYLGVLTASFRKEER